MAFDKGLAERVREALDEVPMITEKRMFGGVAFMSPDYMFVGVVSDLLMARVGPNAYESTLELAHVRPMDFTGKPMRGYVFVDPPGLELDEQISRWVQRCLAYVCTLPKKEFSVTASRNSRKSPATRA